MVSVVRMLQRFLGAMKHAAQEESFAAVVGAAIVLVLAGTITYSLGEGWNVVDGFYFAVCTLTTSSIAATTTGTSTASTRVFSGARVSSGESKSSSCTPAISDLLCSPTTRPPGGRVLEQRDLRDAHLAHDLR